MKTQQSDLKNYPLLMSFFGTKVWGGEDDDTIIENLDGTDISQEDAESLESLIREYDETIFKEGVPFQGDDAEYDALLLEDARAQILQRILDETE